MEVARALWHSGVTKVMESVDHKHEQCCYVPGTTQPTWTLGQRVYSLGNH